LVSHQRACLLIASPPLISSALKHQTPWLVLHLLLLAMQAGMEHRFMPAA
jgi:hypothetical protein